MNELVPGPELSRQLLEAERDCYVAWAEALAASVHRFGGATVVLYPQTPARILNRVFGLTSDDAGHIPEICELFERHEVPVSIDADPYGDGELLPAMAKSGLRKMGFHQMIYGRPRETRPRQDLRI